MSDQPEALRLAAGLEGDYSISYQPYAAAELRRLHGEVESMRAERLHAERDAQVLREAAQMALAVLEQWDNLIEHRYNGTRPAMTDMHYAAQATVPALKALREVLNKD